MKKTLAAFTAILLVTAVSASAAPNTLVELLKGQQTSASGDDGAGHDANERTERGNDDDGGRGESESNHGGGDSDHGAGDSDHDSGDRDHGGSDD